MHVRAIDPTLLDADPAGVREDPGDVSGLAATIADYGLLQPIGVVAGTAGRYTVVYGNRRRVAALELGLSSVPCIVLEAGEPQTLVQQLAENLQRRPLNDLEQARAFARLRADLATRADESALDEQVGSLVGLTGRTVRRYLGLLELPEAIQHYLRREELTVTQAHHLRRVPNPRTQLELARAAVDEGMSAAEISRLASFFAANPTLSLDQALAAVQQGVDTHAEMMRGLHAATPETGMLRGAALGGAEHADADEPDDTGELAEAWAPDGSPPGDEAFETTIENQPKNKARVFRIRSLDQMLDETDRLARAHVDGDLVRWVESDDGAAMKVRLLIKQIDQLARALRGLASQRGWEFDE
jgi:ParB family chromosome partitioning protein